MKRRKDNKLNLMILITKIIARSMLIPFNDLNDFLLLFVVCFPLEGCSIIMLVIDPTQMYGDVNLEQAAFNYRKLN